MSAGVPTQTDSSGNMTPCGLTSTRKVSSATSCSAALLPRMAATTPTPEWLWTSRAPVWSATERHDLDLQPIRRSCVV